jgi:hypothetical protein
MSPFSSSPMTSAPHAQITNLQIYRSQNALFERPIDYSFEHFQQHMLNLMSKNGGHLNTLNVSGQITKEMFDKCYSYNLIDLNYSLEPVTDAISHSFTVSLTNVSKFSVKYHFLLFFERAIKINPTTSEIIKE